MACTAKCSLHDGSAALQAVSNLSLTDTNERVESEQLAKNPGNDTKVENADASEHKPVAGDTKEGGIRAGDEQAADMKAAPQVVDQAKNSQDQAIDTAQDTNVHDDEREELEEWVVPEALAAMKFMHDTEQHSCNRCTNEPFSLQQEAECIKGLLTPLIPLSTPARVLVESDGSLLALGSIGMTPKRMGYVLANIQGGAQEVKGVSREQVIQLLGWQGGKEWDGDSNEEHVKLDDVLKGSVLNMFDVAEFFPVIGPFRPIGKGFAAALGEWPGKLSGIWRRCDLSGDTKAVAVSDGIENVDRVIIWVGQDERMHDRLTSNAIPKLERQANAVGRCVHHFCRAPPGDAHIDDVRNLPLKSDSE